MQLFHNSKYVFVTVNLVVKVKISLSHLHNYMTVSLSEVVFCVCFKKKTKPNKKHTVSQRHCLYFKQKDKLMNYTAVFIQMIEFKEKPQQKIVIKSF